MTHAERAERRKKIAEFVQTHGDRPETYVDAATRFEVSTNVVYVACREHKVGKNRTHEKSLERYKQIADYVQTGGSEAVLSAADKFQVSSSTVRTACRMYRVSAAKMRIAGRTFLIIADLIHTSDTLISLSEKYGVTRQRVSQLYLQCVAAKIPVQVRPLGRVAK